MMMSARNLVFTSTRCLSRNVRSPSVKSSLSALSLTNDAHDYKSSSHATSVRLSSLTSSLANLTLTPHRPYSASTSAVTSTSESTIPRGEPITFLTLNNLHDNPGARKRNVRRLGRGIGSSKGKTSGRGHKGQKSRAGKGVHPTFEGGQTKFYKTLPKVGRMKNAKFKLENVPLNVGKLQDYVTMGRLKPSRSDGVLTMKDFVTAGIMPSSSIKTGVKLLGDGKENVKDPLLIEVPWASATAIEAIEAKGGYVTTVHYNRLAIRALLKPEKFDVKPVSMRKEENSTEPEDKYFLPKRARPPPKYMQYYTDYAKRGYLNPRVQMERRERGLKEIK